MGNRTFRTVAVFLAFQGFLCSCTDNSNRAEDAEKPTADKLEFKTLYVNDFSKADSLNDFSFTDKNAWRWTEVDGQNAMELYAQSKYEPPYYSPFNIALIAGKKFGDFDIELDLMQTGKEYHHRDMCIFLGFEDLAHFYYVHIATAADEHAHSVFLVNDAERISICDKRTKGVDWGDKEWKKVRIERRVMEGTIKVFFDDMEKPVMTTTDKTFGKGMIGVGSFDDTGAVKLIKVMGAEMEEVEKTNLFGKKEKD